MQSLSIFVLDLTVVSDQILALLVYLDYRNQNYDFYLIPWDHYWLVYSIHNPCFYYYYSTVRTYMYHYSYLVIFLRFYVCIINSIRVVYIILSLFFLFFIFIYILAARAHTCDVIYYIIALVIRIRTTTVKIDKKTQIVH